MGKEELKKDDDLVNKIVDGYRLAVRRLLENRAKEDQCVIDTYGNIVKASEMLEKLNAAEQ